MRGVARSIALILASAAAGASSCALAAEPPPDLLKRVAAAEQENAKARDNYTYRQTFSFTELDHRDMVIGQYREVRDVTFTPEGGRFEQAVGTPSNTLSGIKLTPEDFADIRSVQPFFLTPENAFLYTGIFKGEEIVNGTPCFLLHIAPKQILSGQRYFDGLLWVRETDFNIMKCEGQGVPQIETTHEQNLFPHFTTVWQAVDGKWMFPYETSADDTLFFKDWPLRVKISLRYTSYKRFGVESTLTFGGVTQP